VITFNGLGWQPTVQQQNRIILEQPLADSVPLRAPQASSNTSSQKNSQGNTSEQNADEARAEAFAKLKVLLQNPGIAARQQAGASTQESSDATQAFREYMAKTPEDKIKEKVLAELGMTVEEFDALPPEQKARIGEQIAQRIKEDLEIEAQAKLQEQGGIADQRPQGTDLAASPGNAEREKALEASQI